MHPLLAPQGGVCEIGENLRTVREQVCFYRNLRTCQAFSPD